MKTWDRCRWASSMPTYFCILGSPEPALARRMPAWSWGRCDTTYRRKRCYKLSERQTRRRWNRVGDVVGTTGKTRARVLESGFRVSAKTWPCLAPTILTGRQKLAEFRYYCRAPMSRDYL